MLVSTPEHLSQLKKSLTSAKIAIVIDTETNVTPFLENRYCMGISVCVDGDQVYYVPVHHNEWGSGEILTTDLQGVFDVFSSAPIVFHNAKFDLTVLEKLKIFIPVGQIYDTMIMAHLYDEDYMGQATSFELDDLVRHYLGIRKEVALAKAMKDFKWEEVPAKIMAKYAEQDAVATYHLFMFFKNKFDEYEKTWEIDREFMLLLREMELKGVRLNREKTQASLKENEFWVENFKKNLGFDPGKKKELQKYFFEDLGLKPLTFTPARHEPQVNTNFLVKTDTPETRAFRQYKEINKRVTSYYRPYLRLAPSGRFHASYRQHGTVTGRLSCFDPNMQQIPRDSDIKSFFLPEEGCELWEIDYRTLELRLAAVYSQQHNLLEVFKVDGDVHQLTADLLGISRQHAKTVNFAIIYGAGKDALAFQLNCSVEIAAGILFDFRRAYPNLFKKAQEANMACQKNGGKIKMWSGRHRHFRHSSEYHKAFNSIVQGGGFEIVKRSMLDLREKGFDMRNQVHDSVWLNIPTEEVSEKIPQAESIMSDWTEEMFGLKFSVESKRLA